MADRAFARPVQSLAPHPTARNACRLNATYKQNDASLPSAGSLPVRQKIQHRIVHGRPAIKRVEAEASTRLKSGVFLPKRDNQRTLVSHVCQGGPP
jgi:hypothetical protein